MQAQDPALLPALQNAALYPHPVKAFQLIETHISWVLLTGPYAYKIKKAVDLGFLDFTTLERRRYFCEEELRLNRRLAPALYRDVVAITGSATAPCIGGEGTPVEYAVRMAQFAPEAQFDQLLGADRLTVDLVERLAHGLALFHLAADRAGVDDDYGTVESIEAPVRDNFRDLVLPSDLEAWRPVMRRLEAWTIEQQEGLRPVFVARKAAGFVRECHGDLHLANVALYEGAPTPFDCIEFDPQLRWIDVMNEVAFLTMDLDAHGRSNLATCFLNEYLHHTGDYEGLATLRYYQVYRALVRAKIASIRRGQSDAGDRDGVTTYIDLAGRYLETNRAAVVITHGLSGSGKTTLTRRLLAPCGFVRVRSDVERKRLAGFPPDARTHSPIGAGLYSRTAGERTYGRLREIARAICSAGRPALVDATFLQRAQRKAFRDLAGEMGVPFCILDFHATEGSLRERLRGRRPGSDASEADLAVLTQQLATQEPLAPDEHVEAIPIDSDAPPDFAALAARIAARIDGGTKG